MAVITGVTWTAAAGSPEGHYIFAGKVSGVYTHRSSAIPMPTLTGSITVPTAGSWYVAVAGYKTVSGVIIYSAYSTETLKSTSGAEFPPTGTLVLAMRDA